MPDKLLINNNTRSQELQPEKQFRSSFGVLLDWLNLFCLLVALGTVIWSVEQAQWVLPSPSFITIFILSTLAGFILAKSRFSTLVAHLISIAAAITVLFWQGVLLVSGPDLLAKIIHLANNIQEWWWSQTNGIPSTNTLHIALIFGFLTWVIGYFSIWPLIKRRNPWAAVFFGAVVILINLNFVGSDKYYLFFIFLAAALALIALATYTRHSARITRVAQKGINWGTKVWVAVSICLIIIVVSLTWFSPGFRVAAIADYSRANSPFKGSFQLFWQNFFARVPGSGSLKLIHGGQQELQLGGELKLSDQVNYIIKTDFRTYWKTQVYDYYHSGVWKTRDVDSKIVFPDANGVSQKPVSTENALSYAVTPQVNTDVIPAAGDFISGSMPVIETTLSPMVFKVDFTDPVNHLELPPDIYATIKPLMSVNETGLHGDRWQWIESMLPDDLELVNVEWLHGNIRYISIVRRQPEFKDQIALTSAKPVEYQKTEIITVKPPPQFSQDELKLAGSIYPLQIADRYLQLPVNYPGRVKDLAVSITSQYITQFEKVEAIGDYLGDFPYNLKIDAPPVGEDGVDYFLFTQKSGYCTYYASAMTVMLRSIGIPARMVVGFLPGQYDSKAQSYVIRDRDYHAWTEVYFPGYGWITFDPTPNASGESADYSVYYVLPNNPNYSNQDPGLSVSQTPSTTIDFGRYIGMSFGIITGIILLLIIAFCSWIYRQPKSNFGIYSRMVLLSSLAGLGPKHWQTALEYSNHLSTAFPQNGRGINRIIQTYVIDRYSERGSGILSPDELEDSWPLIRNNIIKRWLHVEWLLEK